MPFVDMMELAGIVGEPLATVHRALSRLSLRGIVGRVNHGTSRVPSSGRFYLTANGIRETADLLSFATPADFVRAYPMSKEWLTAIIRRMDAVAAVYRLASTMSPGNGSLRSRVEVHRRGRFDATITLPTGASFGVVRQGLALRRRSLYDRLRVIANYKRWERPQTILILTPSVWEQRLIGGYCRQLNLRDSYIGVESKAALHSRDLHVWRAGPGLFADSHFPMESLISWGSPGRRPPSEPPGRKRASVPDPELMVREAATFGIGPSEKYVLDLVTEYPMIPRDHLAQWLYVSEGRVSQLTRGLIDPWGLLDRQGMRGDTRYALSEAGIRYITNRDRAQLQTTRGIWSTALTSDEQGQGRNRHVGHQIDTWARQTKHADGVTWFLSALAAEPDQAGRSALLWSVPTARTTRPFNWGKAAIAPDAAGELIAGGLQIPFYLEFELRVRSPRGVKRRLRPYSRYYRSQEPGTDQPPFPVTLFVVETEAVEETYLATARGDHLMSLPILVASRTILERMGILGTAWCPLWAPETPRIALADLGAYIWHTLWHRMEAADDASDECNDSVA